METNWTEEERKVARRRWRGDLNRIPVEIAYDFELRWIAENSRADGFRGSARRVAEARAEIRRRADGQDV